MITIRVGAFNTSDPFFVITTLKEFFYCFFYADYSVLAVLICIMIVVALLKIREVVFDNFLYNILLSWDIYRQKIFLEPGGCTHPLCLI